MSIMETSLIELYKQKDLNRASQFLHCMKNMEIRALVDSYKKLRDVEAPQRQNAYFVDTHNGVASGGAQSNRREEHLAIALFNESRANKRFNLPDGRDLEFIDYQTPLKDKQSDKGIGKVDLFAVIDNETPAIIELKVDGKNGSLADTPLSY